MIAVDAVPPEHDLGGRGVRPGRHPAADRSRKVLARARRGHRRAHGRQRHAAGRAAAGRRSRRPTSSAPCSCSAPARRRRRVAPAGGEVHHERLRLRARATPRSSPRRRPPSRCPSGGFAKDAVEVEGYVRGFARRRPDVAVAVLRFANILGPARGHAARRVLLAAGTADGVRLRPAAAVRARGRRDRSAGAWPRLRRGAGRSTAAPSTSPATGCCCCRRPRGGSAGPPCRCCCPRSPGRADAAHARGSRTSRREQIRLLTHGRVVEPGRCARHSASHPAHDGGDVHDFVRSRGPGLLPPERSARGRRPDRGRAAPGAGQTVDGPPKQSRHTGGARSHGGRQGHSVRRRHRCRGGAGGTGAVRGRSAAAPHRSRPPPWRPSGAAGATRRAGAARRMRGGPGAPPGRAVRAGRRSGARRPAAGGTPGATAPGPPRRRR